MPCMRLLLSQRFTGQALGIATGMVASIEGQAEAARTRGREKAAEEVWAGPPPCS